ncbi:Gfo/Idh/MocA family oxidoreductase [Longimicrobium sp.]|uniref:Gfo/Idh/MocA family protein n=1 Tax=Longimicrobium sp. TaxID=2029185 RepID=UPI002C4D92AC|nr:Gfo/Idh/MocA family oxidoreductase [Longimicrobium sp.]HSU15767.1 Gfo/Idh/MocA family oxidoreductase [Longimicrobium sp.]
MTVHRPPIRVAVIGAGAIAQVVHLPILSRMRGVEIAAVNDRDAHTARTIADRYGSRAMDAERIWGDASIQAVVVCTPSHRHEENVRDALAAGKYVLCEKPLALTPDAVERVLAVDGAADRLMVGMNQRFRPDARALRSFVVSGELGDVYYLKTGWLSRTKPTGRLRSWRQMRHTGGGALMDLGLQMLDMAMWTFGYPKPLRVSAHTHTPAGAEVEDSAALLLRLEGDRLINLEVTWSLISRRDRQFMHLLGTAGSGSLSPLQVFRQMDSGLVDVAPALPPGTENIFTASYRNELQNFIEVVRGEQKAGAPGEHVRLMRIMEGAYRSAAEGREIDLTGE